MDSQALSQLYLLALPLLIGVAVIGIVFELYSLIPHSTAFVT